MAYLNLVDYDDGGRIQSLDGLAAVTYDDGATRNLLGARLGAVKYDDGGRFRTLVGLSERLPGRGAFAQIDGLGQDELPSEMPPPDVGLDPSIPTSFPIDYAPPSPAPSFLPFVPSPVVDTASAPITGTLVDTASAPPPGYSAAGWLTTLFTGVKNVVSSAGTLVQPKTPGTIVPVQSAAAASGAGWFSRPSALGVPNWGLLAGVGVLGLGLVAAMGRSGGGGSSRRNPRRRKNPGMELILMGANPRR